MEATIYAPAIARCARDGTWSLRVPVCPICGGQHIHGGGDGPSPAFGNRASHCGKPGQARAYELIPLPA